ncbi:DUF4382 domain-containing protein [Natrinema ejinorense]|uniref:DUF4382 domain-containing protein n=1 Tax=Natrinema ejinorense TaxID=373386 RepID=A0A2A5QYD2_9EURY|nr:DUF4382 domain-containing protein [Natrinema ejinorense]PCR91845.1 hypothetical protein CP557_15745 [Natrinema ejinorense]
MNGRTIQLLLVAALVALAGCTGGMGGDLTNGSTTDDSSITDSSDGAGTAAFYVSDEPNAIDDFEHLNVTITKVGFKKAGDGGDGDSDESDEDDTNESDEETNEETDGNETDEEDGEETNEKEGEEGEGDGDAEDEGWIEHDVDDRTVDLTELKGANASMIDEFELPAGDYEKVFIYVGDTEGVLTDGTETRVKLPSNKLQLNSKFTVGDGERVDFVYDVAPHKAGKSGKYILKPVISQSGTGDKVEINDIDEEDEADDEKEDEIEGDEETEAEDDETGDEEAEQTENEQQTNETDGNETTAEMALPR